MTTPFFIHDYFLALLAIAIFFFCGYGVVSFFNEEQCLTRVQIFLISPLAGISISILGLIFLYTLGISLGATTAIVISLLSMLTIWRLKREVGNIKFSIIFPFLITSFFVSLLCNSNSLREKGPSIQMIGGSDAMGYSMSADWISENAIKKLPGIRATEPHEVLPHQNLSSDQRLGSFVYLALISKIAHRPAFFSYNLAVTIALIASFIGLAAVISSNWSIFYLTISLLFFSQLIDLGNSGFLGKILGYPSIFLVLLLVLKNNHPKPQSIFYYSLLTVAACSLYSYLNVFVLVAFVILLSFIYYIIVEKKYWADFKNSDAENQVFVLIILALIGFACSGGFSILLGDDFLHGWQRGPLVDSYLQINIFTLLLLILNIDYFTSLVCFTTAKGMLVVLLSIITLLIIMISSLTFKNRTTFIIIALPLILMTFLITTGRYWGAYQMSLLLYLCSALAVGILMDHIFMQRSKKLKLLSLFFLVAFIIPHVPRLIEVTNRFVYSPPECVRYSEAEIQQIKNIVGSKKLMIDTVGVYDTQPLLLTLGPIGMNLFFTERSWILTDWGLSYPEYAAANRGDNCEFRISPIAEKCESPWLPVYQGRHYQLASKN
jgi:hypothetical protein